MQTQSSSRLLFIACGATVTHMITPTQSRMARAALGWSTKRLAQEASVGFATVTRFENGHGTAIAATVKAMQGAFEANGVKFSTDNGVALPNPADNSSCGTLTPCDPEFATTMEEAKIVMREDREALRALANR